MVRNGKVYGRYLKKRKDLPFLPLLLIYLLKEDRYLFVPFIDCLIGIYIDWLIDQLVGWLDGWLVG